MSTVISETITTMEELKLREKPTSRLVHTSSLEKIKEFNNYICSQNYIILPALLNWLKSSQHGLESNLDVATAFYRNIVYNILLYKVVEFKILCKGCVNQSKILLNTYITRQAKFVSSTMKNSELLLRFAMYTVVAVVNLEITTCFYLLWVKSTPVGLLFLSICCMWSIVFLLYEAIVHYKEKRRKLPLKLKAKTT